MKTYDPLNYKLSELSRYEPAKGRLLISDPFLPDPYFKRSVVLLADHNDQGSIGFILNKPLDISLGETELKISGADYLMYFGGPVQSTDLFYIHRRAEVEGSQEIKDGIYWGGEFSTIEKMIKEGSLDESEIRFFVGYSGWDAKQLMRELKENSWLVHETDLSGLFQTDTVSLWKNILGELDGQLSILSTFPEDPAMN